MPRALTAEEIHERVRVLAGKVSITTPEQYLAQYWQEDKRRDADAGCSRSAAHEAARLQFKNGKPFFGHGSWEAYLLNHHGLVIPETRHGEGMPPGDLLERAAKAGYDVGLARMLWDVPIISMTPEELLGHARDIAAGIQSTKPKPKLSELELSVLIGANVLKNRNDGYLDRDELRRIHGLEENRIRSILEKLRREGWLKPGHRGKRPLEPLRVVTEDLPLYRDNLKYAIKLAYRRRRAYPNLTREELEAAAQAGLWRAAELFDKAREAKFTTYATPWIMKRLQSANDAAGNVASPSSAEELAAPEEDHEVARQAHDAAKLLLKLHRNGQLSADDVRIVLLRHYAGTSAKQVCMATGKSYATIRARYNHAMGVIRENRGTEE